MPTANPVAVQLYSLRDLDPGRRPSVLRLLADAGYGAVEPFDVLTEPERLRAELDDAGLVACSVHARPDDERFDAVVRGTRTLGAGTVIVPIVDRDRFSSAENIRELAAELNRTADRLAGHGLRLGYHNHEFELATRHDGRTGLEIMAEHLDPRVLLEVDVYWATVGGADVPALLGRLAERVRYLHVKDGPATDMAAPMTAVGHGTLPIAEILASAPSAEWHIVELDRCATSMTGALTDSIDWLVGQGLAA